MLPFHRAHGQLLGGYSDFLVETHMVSALRSFLRRLAFFDGIVAAKVLDMLFNNGILLLKHLGELPFDVLVRAPSARAPKVHLQVEGPSLAPLAVRLVGRPGEL